MNYAIELSPKLDQQLHPAAVQMRTNEANMVLHAVQQYLRFLSFQDPIAEEWLDYGEEMRKESP